MADPAKTDEIEDVLSSIRRLVTEHQPPVADADPAASDRLVLTPALRVTDPEDPWVPVAAQDDLHDETTDLPRGDGVGWAEEMWGDGNPDADPDFDPQLQADLYEEGEVVAGHAPATETKPTDTEWAADDTAETGSIAAPAQDYPGISEEDQASDADEEEPAPVSFIRSPRSVVEYEPEEGHVAVPDEEPPFATLELAEARAAQTALSEALPDVSGEPVAAAAIEEPAAPIGAQEILSDDTPDASDDLSDETPGAARNPGQEPQDDDRDNDAVEDLGESPFSFPDDDVSVVDEDALREIISDVVREELQGEMGKRITRNIRKLVRREIRIALATDELDE